jgi:hypothetical protein
MADHEGTESSGACSGELFAVCPIRVRVAQQMSERLRTESRRLLQNAVLLMQASQEAVRRAQASVQRAGAQGQAPVRRAFTPPVSLALAG